MTRNSKLHISVLFAAAFLLRCGGDDSTDSDLQPQPTTDADVQDQGVPDDSASASDTIESGSTVICPSCDELLTWDTTSFNHSTYGEISTKNNWPDSYAKQMLQECPGWSIFEGHEGGLGDTLEIASCDNGIVLSWAYESFSSIHLSQGWTGTTNLQMAIGSSYEDFIQAYPDFTNESTPLGTNGYAHLNYESGFVSFKDGKLSALYVY